MAQPIKIAILAMGGEGGGVLADWIVDMAEHNGWLAQTTSVPGVAQRTGATIYYVELYPEADAKADGAMPVFALMPLPGDVDLVLASELMEAGRAVQRGLVTPDRTTLVCSTHRVYSIAEKIALGDGRVDDASLLAHARAVAKRFVGCDMAALAEQTGSVISAVLFGALAGTRELPFARAQFEATIERSGVGVRSSLKGFAVGVDGPAPSEAPAAAVATTPARQAPRHADVRALLERIETRHPRAARALLTEGVRRLIDYQDPAYAALYLDRIERVVTASGGDDTLCAELARHLALWMSYEDTIRVADLKIRDTRFTRVRDEVHAQSDQLLAINEYMHPRLQEICDTLPAGLGRWLLGSRLPRRIVERVAARGRVVRTSALRGFLMLWAIAGLRRFRRSTLRFHAETARIETWLHDVEQAASRSPLLALEITRCQRLVKGYGDTHERGLRNFEILRGTWRRTDRDITPQLLRELRDAALADEHGERLRIVLEQHRLK